MAALQEIPSGQRRSSATVESLFHMIACCSYHLAKVSLFFCLHFSCFDVLLLHAVD